MKFIMDESIGALGIKSIVIGIAKNVDPQAPLSEAFLKKQKEMEEWALKCDVDEVFNHPVIQGYTDMLQSVGAVSKNICRLFRLLSETFSTAALFRTLIALSIFITSSRYVHFWQ